MMDKGTKCVIIRDALEWVRIALKIDNRSFGRAVEISVGIMI
jgi:hypothetical protein